MRNKVTSFEVLLTLKDLKVDALQYVFVETWFYPQEQQYIICYKPVYVRRVKHGERIGLLIKDCQTYKEVFRFQEIYSRPSVLKENLNYLSGGIYQPKDCDFITFLNNLHFTYRRRTWQNFK